MLIDFTDNRKQGNFPWFKNLKVTWI